MKTYLSLALVVLVFISCSSPYKIKNQTKPSVDLNKYHTIYVGWLDLGPERWATYNFSTEKEWLSTLKRVNESAVPSYFKEALYGKIVLISMTPKDNPPADSLYIKFTDANFLYDDRILSVTMHFIDGKSKQELSTISVKIKADYKLYYAGYSFDRCIINSIELLALFTKKQIEK